MRERTPSLEWRGLASDASVECDVVFPKAMPYAQFRVLSRDNEPFKNNVWLDIFGEHIKIAATAPLTTSFYWQCGMAMRFQPGRTDQDIALQAKASDRKDFALSLFHVRGFQEDSARPRYSRRAESAQVGGRGYYKPVALRDPAKPKADQAPSSP
jgi:hypothetical protein